MILAWMTYAMMVGALVALAGVAVESLLLAAKRPVRFVWGAAIALTVALAVAAPLRRPSAVRATNTSSIVLPEATSASVELSRAERAILEARAVVNTLTSPVSEALSLVERNGPASARTAIALWLVASATAFLVLIAVYSRFARRRTLWPTMQLFGSRVRVAPDEGPAVMGIAPPEIVIPQWVLSRERTEQQLVIQHESEHVRARDPMLLLAGCVAIALTPWNAALWFMWSRLRLAVELDCDNRVLQRGARKPAYGQLLLELSEQRALLSPIMPAFAFGTSHLEQRLVAMTSRPSRPRTTRRIASGIVVIVALAAACNSELPTASQIEKMDVAAVEARVATGNATEYLVDGLAVSKADANAIAPDRISSISVVRSPKGKTASTINIRTRGDSGSRYVGDTIVFRDQSKQMAFNAAMDSMKRTGRLKPGSVPLRGNPDSVTFYRKPGSVVDSANVLRYADFSPKAPRDSMAMPNGTVVGDVIDGKVLARTVKPEGTGTSYAIGENGARIRVRSDTTVHTGTPLVYIDGVLNPNGFNTLDPKSIETVEVVKGAAARARYGDAASNGVILITLKH